MKSLSALASSLRYRNVRQYTPRALTRPALLIDVESAWSGHELVLGDVIDRFGVGTAACLEFGVEFGYSTVALSNFFDRVTGVDTFRGDVHSSVKDDHFDKTTSDLSAYPNITLVKSDYESWIKSDVGYYDLIHVDIIHTYRDTFNCGLWSAMHSDCTLFHDTESFPDVKRAVNDVARKTGRTFYNYPAHYGLGILV